MTGIIFTVHLRDCIFQEISRAYLFQFPMPGSQVQRKRYKPFLLFLLTFAYLHFAINYRNSPRTEYYSPAHWLLAGPSGMLLSHHRQEDHHHSVTAVLQKPQHHRQSILTREACYCDGCHTNRSRGVPRAPKGGR